VSVEVVFHGSDQCGTFVEVVPAETEHLGFGVWFLCDSNTFHPASRRAVEVFSCLNFPSVVVQCCSVRSVPDLPSLSRHFPPGR
jgi:hypothetical protein